MANGDGHTCGGCVHWHKAGADPTNLGAPRHGLCMERLHSAALPAQGGGLLHHSYYPPVAGANPACSHFEARLSPPGREG